MSVLEETQNLLEIVVIEPKLGGDECSRQPQSEWRIRKLNPNDLHDVCRICREAFPLEYSERWFEEVCSGRLISFGLFHFDVLTALLVAELKALAACDMEV